MTADCWLDRTHLKKELPEWLNGAKPYLICYSSCNNEPGDLRQWLGQHAENADYRVADASCESDSLFSGYGLLTQLISALGTEHFQNFNRLTDEIRPRESNVNVNQSLASDNQSLKNADISGNSQTIYLPPAHIQTLEMAREENIDRFLKAFLEDIRRLPSPKIFFVFSFQKEGYAKISPDSRQWFIHRLCRELTNALKGRRPRIVVITVNPAESRAALSGLTPADEIELPDLTRQEMVDDCGNDDFVSGVVEADDRARYIDYKRKRIAWLRRKREA